MNAYIYLQLTYVLVTREHPVACKDDFFRISRSYPIPRGRGENFTDELNGLYKPTNKANERRNVNPTDKTTC